MTDDLRERARWCVLHGRLANEEYGRIFPATAGRAWKLAIETRGGYAKYVEEVLIPSSLITIVEGDWHAQRVALDIRMYNIKAELEARERSRKRALENFSRAAIVAAVDLLAEKPGAWKPIEIQHGDRAKVRLRWTPRQFT